VIYVPFRQHLLEYGSEDQWLHTRKVLLVRAAQDPPGHTRSIKEATAHVDKDQAAHGFMTMEHQTAASPSVSNRRFLTAPFAVFGALAILPAMIGVYGVMSWVVGQRTTEMGIRMALGAPPGQVARMLVVQSLRPVVLGVVLGTLGVIVLGRLLNSMFWNMSAAEPMVLTAILVFMLAAAMAAALARFSAC
jgi:ABC-type antimicrobial peptide transport system permease subunit